MTTATLFAQLRTQLADAQRPGLAGVRALEATTQTVDALEDAVKLAEQRYADRECVRLGHIVRESMTPAQYHAAEARARAAHPEAWVGRGDIAPDEAAKWAAGGKLSGPGPDAVYDTWHEEQRQKWQDIKLENPRAIQHI